MGYTRGIIETSWWIGKVMSYDINPIINLSWGSWGWFAVEFEILWEPRQIDQIIRQRQEELFHRALGSQSMALSKIGWISQFFPFDGNIYHTPCFVLDSRLWDIPAWHNKGSNRKSHFEHREGHHSQPVEIFIDHMWLVVGYPTLPVVVSNTSAMRRKPQT